MDDSKNNYLIQNKHLISREAAVHAYNELLEKLKRFQEGLYEQVGVQPSTIECWFQEWSEADEAWVVGSQGMLNEVLNRKFRSKREKNVEVTLNYLMAAVVRVIVARNSIARGEFAQALFHAIHGAEEIGVARGLIVGPITEGSKSIQAQVSAAQRHIENRAMREDVFKWMDENWRPRVKSLEEWADDIAKKVVPLEPRTVRDHLTAWKKLRSASRPDSI